MHEMAERVQSPGEEIANRSSHGVALLAAIVAVPFLIDAVRHAGIVLPVAGGLTYTAGVVGFMLDSRYRYAHAAWHCFVAAGTGFHFFAVLGYSA